MDLRRKGALGTLALAAAVAVAAQPAMAATVFRDAGGWVAKDVAVLAAAHVVTGFPNGDFHPNWPVTRAEMVVMIYRATHAGRDAPAPATPPYADVPVSSWYAGDVTAARAGGWLPFVAGTTLLPNQPVTREEAVTILATALQLPPASGDLGQFSDAGAVAPWALPAMEAAVKAGYVHGYPDGTLRPAMPIDRAEAAALLAPTTEAGLVDAGGHLFHITGTLTMLATAYNSGEPGMGDTTATGTLARVGEVAVDPSVIPLGSWLWVQGYTSSGLPAGGILEHAEDTGSAIVGHRIDLYVSTLAAADSFGEQEVTVKLLTTVR